MVAARVARQLRSECDSRAEEEYAVERVDHDHDDRVKSPVRVERGRDQVEEREHRECRTVHRVVDGGWVARECLSNHVTNESHDEQSPYEL